MYISYPPCTINVTLYLFENTREYMIHKNVHGYLVHCWLQFTSFLFALLTVSSFVKNIIISLLGRAVYLISMIAFITPIGSVYQSPCLCLIFTFALCDPITSGQMRQISVTSCWNHWEGNVKYLIQSGLFQWGFCSGYTNVCNDKE